MEEKQHMTNEQLKETLRRHRSAVTLFHILTYGFGIAAILLFATGIIPIAILCFILALVSSYQFSKRTGDLKKTLSDNVIRNVLNEVFDSAEYNPFDHVPDKLIKGAGMVFPFTYDCVRGSDRIKAIYKGLNLELSDVELYHVTEWYNEENSRWEESEERVFQGQWLVCDFGKRLSGEVRLSENTKSMRKQHKNNRIEMENPAFNDRIVVTAEKAQEAYYVLTPHMMDYILTAVNGCGGEIYMSFLLDGKLHIAIKTGRNFFELGKSNTDIESLRHKFLGELHWFTDVVDNLRLEDSLYKKETNT